LISPLFAFHEDAKNRPFPPPPRVKETDGVLARKDDTIIMASSLRVCQIGQCVFLRTQSELPACHNTGMKGTDTFMRQRVSLPRWQRRIAASIVGLFAWSAALSVPAQALAHSNLQKPLGVRSLSLAEMQRIKGRTTGGLHATAVSVDSGSTFPWEASVGGANTANGNKLTQVPLVSWIARGGMPVSFVLSHNSQSAHASELGQKWTHSFDLFLVASAGAGGTDETVHWGDDLAYTFTQNVDGSFSAPTGIHDSLVKNSDGTFTLTRPDQVKYNYTSAGYCSPSWTVTPTRSR
jgi:hypothetical protein